uniref:Uncharacterized protein n=1 Tax=mine drainage metagenome TaxID=410659 RepID=E6PT52_9ZZZZ
MMASTHSMLREGRRSWGGDGVTEQVLEIQVPPAVRERTPPGGGKETRERPFVSRRAVRGAGERNRTLDLLITNELLYQLSYTGGKT